MPYLHGKPFHILPCTMHSAHMNCSFFVFSMINDDLRIFCNRTFWPLPLILLQGLNKTTEVFSKITEYEQYHILVLQ